MLYNNQRFPLEKTMTKGWCIKKWKLLLLVNNCFAYPWVKNIMNILTSILTSKHFVKTVVIVYNVTESVTCTFKIHYKLFALHS